MNPPRPFKFEASRGFSECMACGKWRKSLNYFYADGMDWRLCIGDWGDYWENTDELPSDFKDYPV